MLALIALIAGAAVGAAAGYWYAQKNRETSYRLRETNGNYAIVGNGVRVRMVGNDGEIVRPSPTWTLERT